MAMFDRESDAGCTANFVLIKDGVLYCSNTGDSRCVLSRDGEAIDMSNDHKPNQEREIQRIENAGGFVRYDRVLGSLAVSRSLGDFQYKTKKHLPAED